MSAYRTRRRPRGRTYTDRLRQRPVAARRVTRPGPAYASWRSAGRLLAPLALGAEVGHLASAVVEWPEAAPRGVFHVLAAAVLGLVTVALVFGPSRHELGVGGAATLLIPAGWLAGTLLGASPYRGVPPPAAAILSALEIAVVVFLAAAWRATAPARLTAATDRTGRVRHARPRDG